MKKCQVQISSTLDFMDRMTDLHFEKVKTSCQCQLNILCWDTLHRQVGQSLLLASFTRKRAHGHAAQTKVGIEPEACYLWSLS